MRIKQLWSSFEGTLWPAIIYLIILILLPIVFDQCSVPPNLRMDCGHPGILISHCVTLRAYEYSLPRFLALVLLSIIFVTSSITAIKHSELPGILGMASSAFAVYTAHVMTRCCYDNSISGVPHCY